MLDFPSLPASLPPSLLLYPFLSGFLWFPRREGELVSNFHDYFCFPFLACARCIFLSSVALYTVATFLCPLCYHPLSRPPMLRNAVKSRAHNTHSMGYLFVHLSVFYYSRSFHALPRSPRSLRLLLVPPLRLSFVRWLARSLALLSVSSYLLSCLLYDIYSVDERRRALITAVLRGEGMRTERQCVFVTAFPRCTYNFIGTEGR